MNRSEINRALSKALAYAQAGQFDKAQQWGIALIRHLELAAVFKVGSVRIDELSELGPEQSVYAICQVPPLVGRYDPLHRVTVADQAKKENSI